MKPEDFEAVFDGEGGVTAEIDQEGVVRVPMVPRGALLVVQIEVFERMLTDIYGKGMQDRGR